MDPPSDPWAQEFQMDAAPPTAQAEDPWAKEFTMDAAPAADPWAQEFQMDQQQATEDKPFFNLADTASAIVDFGRGIVNTTPAALSTLSEGLTRPDKWSEDTLKNLERDEAFQREMAAKTEKNRAAGTSSSVGESIREAGSSAGFSFGSMAAAIPATVAGAYLTRSKLGANLAGGLAGGTAAYRMAGARFLNDSFKDWQTQEEQRLGRPVTETEKEAAYQELLPLAQNAGLWEAGPEAIGNMATLGAGKVILGLGKNRITDLAKGSLAKIGIKAGAAAGAIGTELATETATQVGQGLPQAQAEAIAAGQDPALAQSAYPVSVEGVTQAFKDVAPQTLALSGLMMGAAGGVRLATKPFRKSEATPTTPTIEGDLPGTPTTPTATPPTEAQVLVNGTTYAYDTTQLTADQIQTLEASGNLQEYLDAGMVRNVFAPPALPTTPDATATDPTAPTPAPVPAPPGPTVAQAQQTLGNTGNVGSQFAGASTVGRAGPAPLPRDPDGNYDLLNHLNENPIRAPRKGTEGAAAAEYDWREAGDFDPAYRSRIMQEGAPNIDQRAQEAYELGFIPEPTPQALADEVRSAIAKRQQQRQQGPGQSRLLNEQERAQVQFEQTQERLATTGQPIDLDQLAPGDTLRIDGQPVTVADIEYDEDGYTTRALLRTSTGTVRVTPETNLRADPVDKQRLTTAPDQVLEAIKTGQPVTLYHGSPKTNLKSVSRNSSWTLSKQLAQKYATKTGKVYETQAVVPDNNPAFWAAQGWEGSSEAFFNRASEIKLEKEIALDSPATPLDLEDLNAQLALAAESNQGFTNTTIVGTRQDGSTILFSELVNLATRALQTGTRYATWAADLVRRFGQSIKQYLAEAWQAARKTSRQGFLAGPGAILGPQIKANGTVEGMITSAVDVLYGDSKALPKPAKKVSNDVVAKNLQEQAFKQWGDRILNSDTITPAEEQVLVRNGVQEFVAAFNASGKTAADWYTTNIASAMAVAEVLHPELQSNEAAAAVRVNGKPIFRTAADAKLALYLPMAITSQNLNVNQNTTYAEEQFNIFKRTGRFDSTRLYGEKAKSISANLDLANLAIQELGWDKLGAILETDYTVKEISDLLSALTGRKIKIAGRMTDVVQGAAMFGPKIGQGFLQNLMGRYFPVTIDLWMRRTWGRWTGDVLGDGITGDRLARIIDAARASGLVLPRVLTTSRPVYRAVYRTTKKGKQVPTGAQIRTMSEEFLDRLEEETDLKETIFDFSKEVVALWQRNYKALQAGLTAKQFADLTEGRATIEKVAGEALRAEERLDQRYEALAVKPKGKGAKDAWKKAERSKAGRTQKLTTEDWKTYSLTKPEWALAANVIRTQLKPIDAPTDQDRAVISRVVNNIRVALDEIGIKVSNADIQAVLWYPEKDLWAKLRGEEESDLKLSYEDEFLRLANERGLTGPATEAAARVRAARTGGQSDTRTEGGPPAQNERPGAGPQATGTPLGLKNTTVVARRPNGSTVIFAELVDMAEQGIRAGLTLAQWTAAMVQRFGAAVRRFLSEAWQSAKKNSQVGARANLNPNARLSARPPTFAEALEGQTRQSQFGERVQDDTRLTDPLRAAPVSTFAIQGQQQALDQANAIIRQLGLEGATATFQNDATLPMPVRIAGLMQAALQYDARAALALRQGNEAGSAAADAATEAAIQAKASLEVIGNETGRNLAMFNTWARMSPDGQLRRLDRNLAKTAREQIYGDTGVTPAEVTDLVNEETANLDLDAILEEVLTEGNTPSPVNLQTGAPIARNGTIIDRLLGGLETTARAISESTTIQRAVEAIDNVLKALSGKLFADPLLLTPIGQAVLKTTRTLLLQGTKISQAIADAIAVVRTRTPIPQQDVAPLTQAVTSAVVKEVIRPILRKLAFDPNYNKREATKDMLAIGIGVMEAGRLADAIIAKRPKIAKTAQDIVRQRVMRRLSDKPRSKSRKQKLPAIIDTLVLAAGAGFINERTFLDAWDKKHPLPKLTPADRQRLRQMAAAINLLPEGILRQAEAIKFLNATALIEGVPTTDLLLGAWYANILSGASTQGVNVWGNGLNLAFRTMAVGLSSPADFSKLLSGLTQGTKPGLREARETLRTGNLLKVGKMDDMQAAAALELMVAQGGPRGFGQWLAYLMSVGGLTRYVFRAMGAADAVFWYTAQEGMAHAAISRMLRKTQGLKPGTAAFNAEFIRQVGGDETQWLADLDQARTEIRTAGVAVTPSAVNRRAWEIRQSRRSQDIRDTSIRWADRLVMQQQPEGSGAFVSALIGTLMKFRLAGIPVLLPLAPFNRIVSNIFESSLDWAGVGIVRGIVGSHISELHNKDRRRFDNVERGERFFAGVMGLSIGGFLLSMAMAVKDQDDDEVPFMVYAMGPPDPTRKGLMPKGWRPFTMKIGNNYIGFAETPIGPLLGAVGGWLDAVRYGKTENKTQVERGTIAFFSALSSFANMGVLSTAKDIAALFDKNAPGRAIKQTALSPVPGFIPAQGFMRDAATLFDNTKISDAEVFGSLVKDIPVLKSYGRPALNVLGEPIKIEGIPVVKRFTNPQRLDANITFIQRHQLRITALPKTIDIGDYLPKRERMALGLEDSDRRRALGMTAIENGVMTPDQQYAFTKAQGDAIKGGLERLRKSTANRPSSPQTTALLQKQLDRTIQAARIHAMRQIVSELR
jgi:hypothetical protein